MDLAVRLRRTDLYWMMQDTLITRIVLIIGAIYLLAAANPSRTGPALGGALLFAFLGLVAGPVYMSWLTGLYGWVGRTLPIHMDSEGLSGWPGATSEDLSWERVRRIWVRPGVAIMQFGPHVAYRGGRVVIPLRDVPASDLALLQALLASHGFRGQLPDSDVGPARRSS